MPRADKIQRWNTSEIEKILTYINDNFDSWHENHGSTCAKAIEIHNITRDVKSVYNKIHNMIKVAEAFYKTKKKPTTNTVIFENKKIANLLKEIYNKTKEKKEKKENQETTITTRSQNDEERYKLFNELPRKIDQRRNEADQRRKKVEDLTTEIKKMDEEIKKMEGELKNGLNEFITK